MREGKRGVAVSVFSKHEVFWKSKGQRLGEGESPPVSLPLSSPPPPHWVAMIDKGSSSSLGDAALGSDRYSCGPYPIRRGLILRALYADGLPTMLLPS